MADQPKDTTSVPTDPAVAPTPTPATGSTPAEGAAASEGAEVSKKGAKKAEAKAKKEAEKARKAAEREALAASSASASAIDHAKDNYGQISHISKIKSGIAHLRDLGEGDVGKTFKVRAWIQNARMQGAKMAFVELREEGNWTVQGVVAATAEGKEGDGGVVSKQMVKWIGGLKLESFVEVEASVQKPLEPVKSCKVSGLELHLTKVYLVAAAPEMLGLGLGAASRAVGRLDEEEVVEEKIEGKSCYYLFIFPLLSLGGAGDTVNERLRANILQVLQLLKAHPSPVWQPISIIQLCTSAHPSAKQSPISASLSKISSVNTSSRTASRSSTLHRSSVLLPREEPMCSSCHISRKRHTSLNRPNFTSNLRLRVVGREFTALARSSEQRIRIRPDI